MKVFVSSTYEDLADYRQDVQSALLRCDAVFKGMEFFGASSEKTLDHCLSEVQHADLVICLIGTRYGSRPPSSDLSYTEHEIAHAFGLERPVLAYFIDEEQPLPSKHVDTGDDAKALAELKRWIGERVMPGRFTTPPNLAMLIMRDIWPYLSPTAQGSDPGPGVAAMYRETAYDGIAEWYDHWYKDHWCNDEPYLTIRRIASKHADSSKANLSMSRVLDTACGTGNAYAAFKKNHYEIFGCDGSSRMLARAIKNCERANVSSEGIIPTPINWTDGESYKELFGASSFDIIINTGNSFCHIPPVHDYMDVALQNFYQLLKPGGLLIIDTKRYIEEGKIDGIPAFKELRYVAPEWVIRTSREEKCEIPGLESIRFHTRLHYDVDPSFATAVLRALITLTIYGEGLSPQTALIPYYPLPARDLERHMASAGFSTFTYPAGEGPAENWRYEVVVGRKKT